MVKAQATKSTSLVSYGSYDMDVAMEEKEVMDRSGGGAFFKIESGRNVVRFLPPPPSKRSPFVVTYQHYVEPPPGAPPGLNGTSFNCPRMMAKKPCPICQLAERLKGSGSKGDYDLAGKMFPRAQVFANVIARKEPEAGPQVIRFGKKVHEQLVALRENEDAGGDFTDPTESGFDIIIEKTGEKLKTQYKVMADRKSSALGDMEWIAQQADLARFGLVASFNELVENLKDYYDLSSDLAPQRGRGRAAAVPAGRRRGGETIDVEAEEVDDDVEE